MPLFLIIAGLYFTISGVRDTQTDVATLLHHDFVGSGDGKTTFVPWVLAILILGAVGYIETLRTLSDLAMALLLVVLLLTHGGFFEQFFADFGINQNKGLTL